VSSHFSGMRTGPSLPKPRQAVCGCVREDSTRAPMRWWGVRAVAVVVGRCYTAATRSVAVTSVMGLCGVDDHRLCLVSHLSQHERGQLGRLLGQPKRADASQRADYNCWAA
jgi:hypothetical protein